MPAFMNLMGRVRNDLNGTTTKRSSESSRFFLYFLSSLRPEWEIFKNPDISDNIESSLKYFFSQGSLLSLGLGRMVLAQDPHLEFDAFLGHGSDLTFVSGTLLGRNPLPDTMGIVVQFTPEVIHVMPPPLNTCQV